MNYNRQDDYDLNPDDLIAGIEEGNYPITELQSAELDSLQNLDESNDPSYPQQSSSTNQGKPGRTKGRFTIILEMFIAQRKHPKKEFFNAFIIRAIKRAFRQAITGKIPNTTCIAVNNAKESEASIWARIQSIYRRNPAVVNTISLTVEGPLTDGKSKRASGNVGPVPKSFNNDFCKSFYSTEYTRDAFTAIIELIYCNPEPELLCEKFKFRCCSHKVGNIYTHQVDCAEKWHRLYEYFNRFYFQDMEVDTGMNQGYLGSNILMNEEDFFSTL